MSSISMNSPGWKASVEREAQRPSAEPIQGYVVTPVNPTTLAIPAQGGMSGPSPVQYPGSGGSTSGLPWEGYGEAFKELTTKAEQFAKQVAKESSLKAKALKMAKVGPHALGVQIGWELGDLLFPNGFYDLGFGQGVPDEAFGPDGWTNPRYDWNQCSLWPGGYPNGGAGTVGFITTGSSITSPTDIDCYNGNNGTAGHLAVNTPVFALGFTSINAWQNCPLTHGAPPLPTPHRHLFGSYRFNADTAEGPYDPNEWEQVYTTVRTKTVPLASPRLSEFPETFPMTVPMQFPHAQPWRDAAPRDAVREQTLARQRADVMPLTPFPLVQVLPGSPSPPDIIIDVPVPVPDPGTGQPVPPTVVTRPPSPRRARPSRGTKEKKLSVRSKANAAWLILNGATEVFDFIDSLFKGLPEEIQKATKASIDYGRPGGGKADPYSKAKAVYDNFKQMDWDKAINAYLNNQLEDMVVGMVGMAGSHANKASGAGTGGGGAVQARPGKAAEAYSDDALDAAVKSGEMTKAEAEALDLSDDLPIPTVEYDPVTGQWIMHIPQWGLSFT